MLILSYRQRINGKNKRTTVVKRSIVRLATEILFRNLKNVTNYSTFRKNSQKE